MSNNAYTMKPFVKEFINFFMLLIVSPLLLSYKISCLIMDQKQLFPAFSQFMSLFPGKTGSYLRINFYRFSITNCHKNCVIGFDTLLSQINTEIAEGVYIGAQCNIGSCQIEKNCLLGSGVHVMSGKHQHNFSNIDIPIQKQGGHLQTIVIGEDSWIGNGALIMANIGKKCIIGAGAVVTKDIEDYSIVAGNPAKLIGKRTLDDSWSNK